jgi:hypothetical protein
MKTAVDFLHSEYNRILGSVLVTPQQIIEMSDALENAKEIEKGHISKAYFEGWSCPHGEGFPETGEQYYNQTFTNSPEIPTSSNQQ